MADISSIRVVLVNPSHPGNIGAAARAMKLMGLRDLVLVAPQRFPDPGATARATGAADLLEQAKVVPTLAAALSGITRVYATSARSRTLAVPTNTARECATEIASNPGRAVALVFGRERTGLTNEELAMAHVHVTIPTAPDFSSLNLAQAVQIVAYECFQASMKEVAVEVSDPVEPGEQPATMQQLAGYYDHLRQTLTDIEFLKPRQSTTLMRRLMRLYNRAELSVNELNILRGILSDVDYQMQKRKAQGEEAVRE